MAVSSLLSVKVLLALAICLQLVIILQSHSHEVASTAAADSSLAHPAAASVAAQNNATKVYCIILKSTIPYHPRLLRTNMGHAAQVLLPCWSWFGKFPAAQCGLIVGDGMSLGDSNTSWARELIRHSKCSYEISHDAGYPYFTPNATHMTPNLLLQRPRFNYLRYFDSPEHAWELRRQFLSDDNIRKKRSGADHDIGCLQRGGPTRVISNLKELCQGLQQRLLEANKSARIHYGEMEDMVMPEQAQWFATKSIIIAAHGAALANCAFLFPGTVVMQLYPKFYFYQFYDPLIEQTAGIALDWYDGSDPNQEWVENKRKGQWIENTARTRNLTPPVLEVTDKVMAALNLHGWTREDYTRWFS